MFLENYINYMKGEEIDSIPLYITGINQVVGRSLGYSLKEQSTFEVSVEILQILYEKYGIDIYPLGISRQAFGENFGSVVDYPENSIEYISSFIMKDKIDLSLINDKNIQVFFESKLKSMGKIIDALPQYKFINTTKGSFTYASGLRSEEKLLRDTRKDNVKLKALLDKCLEYSIKWIELFDKEFGHRHVYISDPSSSLSLLSEVQYREFILPNLITLIEEIYSITKHKPSIHLCGSSKEIWQDLKKVSLSGIYVDNCEDLGVLKETLGDNMTIVGNIPPIEVLIEGDKSTVKDSVDECILKGADNKGGFILNAGCAVSPYTPIENIDFIYEYVMSLGSHKLGNYPTHFNIK